MDSGLAVAATAAPLDDENLLHEILLRLPPQPSSLPRASVVCRRWRRILTDPQLLRGFRKHHRKPPLLGFFFKSSGPDHSRRTLYNPILDSPNRIPTDRFSMLPTLLAWDFMGCRHGLSVSICDDWRAVTVWDPLTGQQHLVTFPPWFNFDADPGNITADVAVLRPAGYLIDRDFSPFKLVLACTDGELGEAFACTYQSDSAAWGDSISVATPDGISDDRRSILVGDRLCWLLDTGNILEFDLERLTLALIEKPADAHVCDPNMDLQILRGGGDNSLGLAVFSDPILDIQLWARKPNSEGAATWVLQKTINLSELFSPLPELVLIRGYDEDTNVIFLTVGYDDFMLQLDSAQLRCIGKERTACLMYYPYTNFYTAGSGVPCAAEMSGLEGGKETA